ncbi:hypothetical protein [Allomesorhizobium alhagi]|uniref:Uncharacterized protein n=1 Tax=Mesorhizobium alhagi CCNWXJ12-2 TaxID=1107882 RepID=H0HMA1_9HYPH|nr:hypothetical protein [Mesorhizobium alhagi]EHK58115.1 hypothetical protein MAXJ12_06325 [Mesorhizobium alhagi CCNWXJ12-2]
MSNAMIFVLYLMTMGMVGMAWVFALWAAEEYGGARYGVAVIVPALVVMMCSIYALGIEFPWP